MKKLLLSAFLTALVSSIALAEGAPRGGAFGIQTSVGFTSTGLSPGGSLGVKYVVTDNVALRASLGLNSSNTGGASTAGYDLGVGGEYHFGGKGGVSPYVGVQLGYSGGSISSGAKAETVLGLNAVFGGEYFFSSNFSWAGEIGLGYTSDSAPGTGVTTTTFGTVSGQFLFTWYIN